MKKNRLLPNEWQLTGHLTSVNRCHKTAEKNILKVPKPKYYKIKDKANHASEKQILILCGS